MNQTKNFGFIPPKITSTDYWRGSGKLGSVDLNPSGDWRKFLPVFEAQNRGFETNSCVSQATTSALEMLHKFQYGIEPNYSDRYLAKLAGTSPEQGGTTPKIVSDTLRHKGCVPESEWPFDASSLINFYKAIPQKVIDIGLQWLKQYDFGYEWVDTDTAILKATLKRSPIAVAVNAWNQNAKGEYIKLGNPNHYVVLIAYDEQGRPIIFDSYESSLKTLEKNYEFEYAQMYKLSKKETKKETKKKVIKHSFLYNLCNALFNRMPIE